MGVTAWNYQACTELPLEPITSDGYGFFPPADGAPTRAVAANCAERFGVATRAEWARVAFGDGADLARSLRNVYFAENEKDPWHVGTESIAAALNASGGGGGGVYRRLARAARTTRICASRRRATRPTSPRCARRAAGDPRGSPRSRADPESR